MRLRELEQWLSQVDAFDEPKIEFEQYPTSAHIAAHMLYTMENNFGDIADKCVMDMGCGCGVLAIGCTIMGAGATIGLDLDPDALAIAAANCDELEVPVDLVNLNAVELAGLDQLAPLPWRGPKVDTVIMNPPFGTKQGNEGIDMLFVKRGLELADVVYSLHKTSTRPFITRKAAEWGVKLEVLAELRYDLPKSYKFHKKKSVDIEVDFLRFSRDDGSEGSDAS